MKTIGEGTHGSRVRLKARARYCVKKWLLSDLGKRTFLWLVRRDWLCLERYLLAPILRRLYIFMARRFRNRDRENTDLVLRKLWHLWPGPWATQVILEVVGQTGFQKIAPDASTVRPSWVERWLFSERSGHVLVWLAKKNLGIVRRLGLSAPLFRLSAFAAARLLEKKPEVALLMLYCAVRLSPNQTPIVWLVEAACARLRDPEQVLDFLWDEYRKKKRTEASRLLGYVIVYTNRLSHPAASAVPSFEQRHISTIGGREGRYRKISDGKVVKVNDVPCFGESHLVWTRERPIPESFVAEVQDVLVMGQTFAVFSGQTVWNFSEETTLPYLSGNYSPFFHALPQSERYLCPAVIKPPDAAHDTAVLIMNRVGFSYFHWIYECLPRLFVIDRLPEYAALPVVVGGGMIRQNYELLGLVNRRRRPVIQIRPGDVFSFKTLIVPSNRSYMPDDPRLRVDRAVIDPDAVLEVREAVNAWHEALEPENNILWISRKAYVSRFNYGYKLRDIVNADEIEQYLCSVGAKVFRPEVHSVQEQRLAFYHARVVVLVTGSAAANIIFCRPGTKILFLSQNRNVNPGLFISIANTLDLDAALVVGEGIPDPGRPPTHWDFEIKLSDLGRALRWADSGGCH